MESMVKEAKKLILKSNKLRHYLSLVSVISLCSSLVLLYHSSLTHYLKLYNLSSLPSQILSHTIDKNCMFLLCNGLLVFLGITISFSNPQPHHVHDLHVDDELLEPCTLIEDHTSEVEVIKDFMVEEEDGGGGGGGGDDDEEEEESEGDEEDHGKENGVLVFDLKAVGEEKEEEWLENEEIYLGDEESVEEENWRLSTEQMNKRFDDFIRRMREDLKIEAKQQIVMVYN